MDTSASSSRRMDTLRRHILAAPALHAAPHLASSGNPAGAGSFASSDDPIVIVSALRTPICKARRGGLATATPDLLLATVIKATLDKTGVDPSLIGDIVVGNVLSPGGGAAMARIAQLLAGISHTVPLSTVNRQCSSGLQSVASVASALKAGVYDIGLACGVESMTKDSMGSVMPTIDFEVAAASKEARDALIPMGITSENVAARYGISREVQDQFASDSHRKAAHAQAAGWFDAEIVPVDVPAGEDAAKQPAGTVARDDGIRAQTTPDTLAKLKPAFAKGGSTTAGNSSQTSDGAAAVLMMRQSKAAALGLGVLCIFRSYAVVGVPPAIMGIGPAFAIPAALHNAGLAMDDIDVFEVNEAFASQATYCAEQLKIPPGKLNPKGGAIALGHPLGCTGARQVATLGHELSRTGKRYGVVSMCIGTGMGAAAVFERPL